MSEYGTMVNGQLICHKKYKDGDKPLVRADCPESEYICFYHWEEREDGIYQVWQITDVLKEAYEEELTDTEALAIIMGGSV